MNSMNANLLPGEAFELENFRITKEHK